MSAKHTPGPWFYDRGNVFVDDRHNVCCGRPNRSGECCGNPEIDGEYFQIAECGERDAPLIAAAPDLLMMLERAREELRMIYMKDAGPYDPTLMIGIDLALAKPNPAAKDPANG